MSTLTIIIPAYNEQAHLPLTLAAIRRSISLAGISTTVIVVDSSSTDRTSEVATASGADVVLEDSGGTIAGARNIGGRYGDSDYLLFLDADVIIAEWSLTSVSSLIDDCVLGVCGLRAIYLPRKLSSWILCSIYDWHRSRGGPAQGVAQLVRRSVFEAVGGYDESLMMSEDADFFIRAEAYAKDIGLLTPGIVNEAIVWPSTRRYDKWSAGRMLLYQNPLSVRIARRSRHIWRGWRTHTVR
ncbi:glycosyltransferase family 2 protein [Pseudactinotalea sp. HY158]|uniref:glycosyltransferase family 2 protein n=1 Tax=Pseudactinotalea sp. HY158 TaxID=2654547 RepID=UPI00129C5C41|nr:glycosyltransferase [Pseudactinotalea sp. HY158]